MKSLNESKYGFWGTLARKAKTFIDNDETSNQFQGIDKNPHQTVDRSTGGQVRMKSWILFFFIEQNSAYVTIDQMYWFKFPGMRFHPNSGCFIQHILEKYDG